MQTNARLITDSLELRLVSKYVPCQSFCPCYDRLAAQACLWLPDRFRLLGVYLYMLDESIHSWKLWRDVCLLLIDLLILKRSSEVMQWHSCQASSTSWTDRCSQTPPMLPEPQDSVSSQMEKMQDDLWPARERNKNSWFCREGFRNWGCLFHTKRNWWNELGAKSACANRSNAIYILKVKGAGGGRTSECVHARVGGWDSVR